METCPHDDATDGATSDDHDYDPGDEADNDTADASGESAADAVMQYRPNAFLTGVSVHVCGLTSRFHAILACDLLTYGRQGSAKKPATRTQSSSGSMYRVPAAWQ